MASAAAPALAGARPMLGQILGVNLAGAEFGTGMPGVHGTDYIWPPNASADYYLDRGMRLIRVPFRWERLEASPGAGWQPAEIGHLDRLVRHITGRGGVAVLDLHNYGRWKQGNAERIIGQGGPSTTDFAGLWLRLATRYLDLPGIAFGLMNEPHDQDMTIVVRMQQQAIDAIRSTGARQPVLVTGNHWSGALTWVSSGNGEAMLAITDPADNFAFDVHQYLDPQNSGATNVCVPGAGAARLMPFTEWARRHGRVGFLGEFNAGPDTLCLAEMTSLLDHLQANPDVWLGAAYWAGGPWWGNEVFTVEPADLANPVDRPQMTVLAQRARSWR